MSEHAQQQWLTGYSHISMRNITFLDLEQCNLQSDFIHERLVKVEGTEADSSGSLLLYISTAMAADR